MRIFGALLILFGILLCFTIIAAPFGIFLMIVGVVLCLIGGRRKTVINNVVQVSATPGPTFQQANVPEIDDKRLRRVDSPLFDSRATGHFDAIERSRVVDVMPTYTHNGVAYDQTKWNTLVRYDADIARLVEVLSPYGQKYVDEFATAYLALNDKQYLPIIIDKIVASAKQDAARRTH